MEINYYLNSDCFQNIWTTWIGILLNKDEILNLAWTQDFHLSLDLAWTQEFACGRGKSWILVDNDICWENSRILIDIDIWKTQILNLA